MSTKIFPNILEISSCGGKSFSPSVLHDLLIPFVPPTLLFLVFTFCPMRLELLLLSSYLTQIIQKLARKRKGRLSLSITSMNIHFLYSFHKVGLCSLICRILFTFHPSIVLCLPSIVWESNFSMIYANRSSKRRPWSACLDQCSHLNTLMEKVISATLRKIQL